MTESTTAPEQAAPGPELAYPIRTVFFDIGGVLLTNGWDLGQRTQVLTRFNVDLAQYEKRHDAANWRWERGLETARWFFDRTLFYEPRSFTFEQLWPEVEAQSGVQYPETYDVLRELRASAAYRTGALRIATLNNESRELNDYRVRAFGLRDCFDFFICSGYAGEMKPHAGLYRTALEVSQTPPGQTVFIDDKPENCKAAQALGMHAIHFTSPQQLRSALTALGVTL